MVLVTRSPTSVVISNNPFPYHTPILNALADQLPLTVVYMSRSHPLDSFADLWGTHPRFEYRFYRSLRIRAKAGMDLRLQLSLGVSSVLQRLRPDVVVFSSWGPLVWEPLAWKRCMNGRAVMWAESTSFSGLARGALSNRIRRAIIAQTDAYVTNGSQASEYLIQLGADRSSIVTSRLPSPLRPGEIAFRPDHGSPRFLFVGRLIGQKRPLELITAFRRVLPSLPCATLTLVGDGPLENAVRSEARSFDGRVVVLGRLEGESLSATYSTSDVLVVPSVREVWGLVVNEGLAHGLYVVASDQVGSAYDLLDDACGVMYRSDNEESLVRAMISAAHACGGAREAEARARSVRDCTPLSFANDLHKAIVLATGGAVQ